MATAPHRSRSTDGAGRRVGDRACRASTPRSATACSAARCGRSPRPASPTATSLVVSVPGRARDAARAAAARAGRRLRRAGRARRGRSAARPTTSRSSPTSRPRGVVERAARVRHPDRQRHPDLRDRRAGARAHGHEGLRGGAGGARAREPAPMPSTTSERRAARRRARELVLQGLYQRQLVGQRRRGDRALTSSRAAATRAPTQAYFDELWRGVDRRARTSSVGRARAASSTARPPELSPIERAILASAPGSSSTARDPVPRRHQRGGRAREVLRRHRRPQVRQRRAGQARGERARGEIAALRRERGAGAG